MGRATATTENHLPRPRQRPSGLLTALRRIPMPLLSILIGLVCGGLVWLVLDQVQPRALRDIFVNELQERLEQQARETLIRFDNYVESHISTTRLLANHRNLANYLEPIYWFQGESTPPVIYYRNPPWLPAARLWRTLVQPAQILLIDRWGRTREIYNVGNRSLPGDLLDIDELFLSQGRVQGVMITLHDRPYLLISERVEDATGTYMGFLMLVVPIDDAFLRASLEGVSSDEVVVGLMEVDEQRFLSSSDPKHVPVGARRDQVARDYVITAQSFAGYEGSDLNLLFATLVPRSSVEATRQRVASVERRQRLITSITFIAVFTLVFYLLSERLNRILRRISLFSRRALGSEQPVIEKGNQIFVLEDWIRQFIGNVRRAREQMRREHETEMQESEALKQAIMEAALDAIVTLDEDGNIIEFNSTAERMFGLRRDEVIGQDFPLLIIAPESRSAFTGLWWRFRRGGVDLDEEESRSEMEAVRDGGERFPVEVTIKPIRLQRRQVFTVYIHDISSRRRAEQEIRNMAKFVSESPSPVLRVSRRGVILYANPASTPLLEYWDCEQGQTLPVYWRERVTRLCESGRNWEGEITYQGRAYSLLMTPIVDLDYVNIYGRDITAIREAESLAREHQQELVHVCRLSTMGEMATGLAHELNQPLSAIANYANGCARRLQAAADGGDLTFALKQINDQAERAGEIIRRLRRLVGKQLPVRNITDANELVREVSRFVEFEAKKAGVVIEQEPSLDPLQVRVDIVQMEQVLLNLVRNALDALMEVPPEQRRLQIRSRREGEDLVRIDVIDSGPGIAPEVLEHLFEPFFTTKQSGMGMGLVISDTIVKDHDGRIEATPLAEGGSRFSVILPAYRGEQEEESE